jgi:hypothetical protein
MKPLIVLLAAAVAVMTIPWPAHAQEATLSGIVSDAT